MRVVFMGTPQLAATVLGGLADHHDVVAVFTRPDAVRGRGKKLVPSQVKEAALERGITVYEPRTLLSQEVVDLVRKLDPDVICVAAYGCLLPKPILDIPRHGCLNVHTSLLPRWRGAAPIDRAILAGDECTGVCIMRMEEGLDTGPYCRRRSVPVQGRTLAELTEALGQLGAEELIAALSEVQDGTVTWHEQGEDGLVYAEKIGKRELNFAPEDSTREITAKVRVANESHPSKIAVAGKTISVECASAVQAQPSSQLEGMQPGQATFSAKRLLLCASDGLVELERVKPDGKKSMEGRAFAAGLQGIKNQFVTWGRA